MRHDTELGDLTRQHSREEMLGLDNGLEPHREEDSTGYLTFHVDHQCFPGHLRNGLHGITLGWDVGKLPGISWGREAEEQGQFLDGLSRVYGGLGHIL